MEDRGTPKVALHGWRENSPLTLWQVMETYLEVGLRHVLCTDIGRDGMLRGPNDALYDATQKRFPGIQIQASGGVSSLADIRRMKELGLAGVVVGKALYERRFTLPEALAC
jgi:phosphoribosylformimino-5-aminoimidazole carboxamide ribotide isomerase